MGRPNLSSRFTLSTDAFLAFLRNPNWSQGLRARWQVAGRRFSALFIGNSHLFLPQSREKSLAHPPTLERVPIKNAG
jgi:hypothetical protein